MRWRGEEGSMVRAHSFSRGGRADAGKREGSEKAEMLLKMLDAYGRVVVGPGTQSGWILG